MEIDFSHQIILSFIKAHNKCKEIQGFVVEFPLEFLADDVLMPKWNTSEGQFEKRILLLL